MHAPRRGDRWRAIGSIGERQNAQESTIAAVIHVVTARRIVSDDLKFVVVHTAAFAGDTDGGGADLGSNVVLADRFHGHGAC